jgi:hypothetical protein
VTRTDGGVNGDMVLNWHDLVPNLMAAHNS